MFLMMRLTLLYHISAFRYVQAKASYNASDAMLLLLGGTVILFGLLLKELHVLLYPCYLLFDLSRITGVR
jgi:hypothetical protein